MRGFVPLDPESSVSTEQYAVVYSPRRDSARGRTRFPAGNVEILGSAEVASAQADEAEKRYAARVLGPSKSSEGVYIYYLMEWL
ncbi:MAG: hypothetical protein IME93_03790 [Proteobacteria bacterium]|nr:hypothetical protein [Pseudomonadota bacterium]